MLKIYGYIYYRMTKFNIVGWDDPNIGPILLLSIYQSLNIWVIIYTIGKYVDYVGVSVWTFFISWLLIVYGNYKILNNSKNKSLYLAWDKNLFARIAAHLLFYCYAILSLALFFYIV